MAIVYADPVGSPTGTITPEEYQFSRTFTVDYGGVLQPDAAAVLSLPEIPNMWSPYPGYPGAVVQSITPKQESNGNWTVEVNYTTKTKDKDKDKESPFDEPPIVEWDSVEYQEVMELDADGKAVLNSAGVPFNPPPMISRYLSSISVKWNVPETPDWAFSIVGKTNDEDVTIEGITFPEGGLLVKSIKIGAKQEKNGFKYRVISGTLEGRPRRQLDAVSIGNEYDQNTVADKDCEGHDLLLLDSGYEKYDPSKPSGSRLIKITNQGINLSNPRNLDGKGGLLNEDDEPVYRLYKRYKKDDFSVMNIPTEA